MALPEPVGKQAEVVYLPAVGHNVVLGTAGSGKTTMAVARAKYLAHPNLPGGGATLVVTFNKALTNYIAQGAGGLPANVHVRNYHHFARGYLSARGRMGRSSILPVMKKPQLIAQAVEEMKDASEPSAFFDRRAGFFVDEIKWICAHNIRTLEQYEQTVRIGRAEANLSVKLRPLMWSVLERYRELRAGDGYQYDLDDLACAVTETLAADDEPRMYRHIIIDEGQDFTPEMIRSLVGAVPHDGSITFFGDVAQQIYGRRLSWRDAGLRTQMPWEFKQNYRNTLSIARLGLAIAQMPYYLGEPDMVAPIMPNADGPKPALIQISHQTSELDFLKALVASKQANRSVAVLLRTHAHIKMVRPYLPQEACHLKDDAVDWVDHQGVYYGTYHAAKGLEFDVVILPFLASGAMPSEEDIVELGADEANAQDGRLLYVGVTRAKSELFITYSGSPTDLLPKTVELYSHHTR